MHTDFRITRKYRELNGLEARRSVRMNLKSVFIRVHLWINSSAISGFADT